MNSIITDKCYRFVFEHSADAILLTSPDGSIYRANLAACKMLQYTEEELCKLGRSGIVDINDCRLPLLLEERMKHGQINAELNFVRKDGSVFPAECTSALFKDEQGSVWTVIIIRDITVFKQAEEVLRRKQEETERNANYDYLTGVLNRRAFLNVLQEEMRRVKTAGASMILFLMDIDAFKSINDMYGHQCGDTILKNFATFAMQMLRSGDILGRYGGDEFIVCLPDAKGDEAYDIAVRLKDQVKNANMTCDKKPLSVTVSIGITSYNWHSNLDIDILIAKLDKNMYGAKKHRNCVYGLH